MDSADRSGVAISSRGVSFAGYFLAAAEAVAGRRRVAECLARAVGRTGRRRIVERTYAWLGQFRRLLVRHEHLLSTYCAFFYLACFWITLRHSL